MKQRERMVVAPGKLTDILDRLETLSTADLGKLEKAIWARREGAAKALAGIGPDNGPAADKTVQHGIADPWGEVLLDCIVEVTRETIGYPIGKNTLRSMVAYHSFRKKLPELIEFIEHAAPEFHQRRAICKLGIELLFSYLHRPDQMTGPTTLMHQIHRMPEALNAQFPDYARAGMLGLIARREKDQ